MKINWKVRFKQKQFVVAFFALVFLLVQQVLSILNIELTEIASNQIVDLFNTVLAILVLLGIVVDPTTQGVNDSDRALNYDEPNKE